jgi:iduronate 2-sulfatase
MFPLRIPVHLLLFIYLLSSALVTQITATEKPNVLLIVCDDLNDYLVGGHPLAKTPNIDQFTKSAVRFSNAFSNNPVCAPSRASCLTGIYGHTSMNLFWSKWYENPVLKNSKSIMEHFKDNGYHVMGSGKLMHHHRRSDWSEYKHKADYGPYWFDGEDRVAHPSVREPFRSIGPIDGSFGSLADIPKNLKKGTGWKNGWGREAILDFSPISSDQTPDEINAEWASEQIKRHASGKSDRPLFLAIGFTKPHTPLNTRQKYFDMFPLEDITLPKYKEGDSQDIGYSKELFPDSKGLKYFAMLKESYPNNLEGIKKFAQAYLACVAEVDNNIGTILKTLDSTSLKENTIVIITSDHGWNMGAKDFLFKNAPWDESSKVPFIIRAPGFGKANTVCHKPISLIDLYPTLVDLCNLKGDTRKNDKGAALDGFSIKPLLEDTENGKWEGPDEALTMIFSGGKNSMNVDMQNWTLRSENYRYIRYNNGFEELYDSKRDPNEWNNIANNPEFQNVIVRMRERLKERIPTQAEINKRLGIQTVKHEEPNANKWKDQYFTKNPSADTDGDGKLSWAELQAHKTLSKNN